jgi:hypothetical protein
MDQFISGAAAEVALGKRAAGAGLQVLLEASRGSFIWKLQRDDDRPRSMLTRMTARAGVMPLEAFIDVSGPADVVS